MKKLLLALAASLALTTLPAAAQSIAYYYGTVSSANLPIGGNATITPSSALLVVDYGSGAVELIALTSPTHAGSAFDYKLTFVGQLDVAGLSSNNGVSYTYIVQSNNQSSSGAVVELQKLLYGPNSQVVLKAGSAALSIPKTLTGPFVLLQQTTTGAPTGNVKSDTYNVSIVLPASLSENANNKSFSAAVNDADAFFAGINGNKVP